jgi:hypothetical protein
METQVVAAIVGGLIAIAGAAVSYLYRTRHEKAVVNKAVLAEISRLLFVLDHHEKWWRGCIQSKNTNYPLIPFATDVYKEQTKKIGIIDESVIVHVVKFYGYVGYLNTLQSIRTQYASPTDFDKQYLQSLETILADYGKVFGAAFKKYEIVSV